MRCAISRPHSRDPGEARCSSSIPLGPRSYVHATPKPVWRGRPCCEEPIVCAHTQDETFGFLYLSLIRHRSLPFLSPAFTAQLDVTYKKVRSMPANCAKTGLAAHVQALASLFLLLLCFVLFFDAHDARGRMACAIDGSRCCVAAGSRQKLPVGTPMLCTTWVDRVERRKVFMAATLTDGPSGETYATATALFVAPRPQKMIAEGVKYVTGGLFLPKG